MSDNVIYIRFHEDLDTRNKNELRCRMEYAKWRKEWQDAVDRQDYEQMDRLDMKYQTLGLP